ncbi:MULTISPECIES: DUF4436 family protein [unclassified Kitasatospora]|uniref:DUF4436 family protein n=1 Tax=unclassified Kitasatospora TaxID=2633591 RepID=UPI00340F18E1
MGTAVAVMAVACGIGLVAFLSDVKSQPGGTSTGAADAADRLSITASVQRVNAGADDLDLRVLVVPHGALSAADGVSPTRDITVSTSGITRGTLTFPAGQRINAQDLLVGLESGEFADYPFDRYKAEIYFAASVDGKPVPAEVELVEADPLFTAQAETGGDRLAPGFDVELRRSRGNFTMAWLMFAVMWALALAVAAGALVIGRTRKGMVWPALGWMAATLFALAGFRNIAPGSPPIGCLLDYTAFLWAEAIVAFSVVYVVLRGAPVELTPPPAAEA